MAAPVARQLGDLRRRLDETLARQGADAQLFGDTGRHYHAYGILDAAEACYRNAEGLAPGDFRWPYLLALVQREAGRPEDAVASLGRALAAPDRYYPAFVHLATIELELGRLDAAARALDLPRVHAADDPAFLAVDGELALRERRYEAALDRLLAALERQPHATRLHYPVAMAYRALGRTDDARAHLAKAGRVGVRPADPLLDAVLALRVGEPVYMIEGHTALRAGDLAAAAAAFAAAVDASGGTSRGALTNLAAVEVRQGLTAQAIDHLEQARRLEPQDVTVLYNLGIALVHTSRYAEAEPVLRQVADLAPDDEGARLGLARTLLALDKAAEGLDLVARLSTVERSQCDPLIQGLDALSSTRDPDVAGRAAEQARRIRTLPSCTP
jgi:tetratricopeptide (TPR) repeat protein